MERGLAAPVAFGPGEEWRVTSGEVPKSWKEMPIDEFTFPHFVPRLGFLLHDMDMDKEKLSSGAQKFILKTNTEGSNQPRLPKTPYLQIQVEFKVDGEWMMEEEGMEEVQLDSQMVEDLAIDADLLRDVKERRKRLVGKL